MRITTLIVAVAKLSVLALSYPASAAGVLEHFSLPVDEKQSDECRGAVGICGLTECKTDDCCDAYNVAIECIDNTVRIGVCATRDVTSIRTELEESAKLGGCGADCFPATATFFLENGSVVAGSELQTGDRVMSSAGRYSEVFFFSHRDLDSHRIFVKIQLGEGLSLTLSRGHLIPIDGKLVEARHVHLGDQLTLASGAKDVVRSINLVQEAGLINPHTSDGTIIVDGVQVSCYTSGLNPQLASLLLLPIHMAYKVGLPTFKLLSNGAPKTARLLNSLFPSSLAFPLVD